MLGLCLNSSHLPLERGGKASKTFRTLIYTCAIKRGAPRGFWWQDFGGDELWAGGGGLPGEGQKCVWGSHVSVDVSELYGALQSLLCLFNGFEILPRALPA